MLPAGRSAPPGAVTQKGEVRMVAAAKKFADIIHFISKILWYACAALLFCLACVTFVDCLLRYVGGRSIPGCQELTEVGMGYFVYAGIAGVIWKRHGIQVPIVMDKLSPRGKNIMRFILDILSLLILLVVATQVLTTAKSTLFTSSILKIPYAPVYYFAVAGSFLACIEFVIHIVEDFYGIFHPVKPEEESEVSK